MRRAGACREFSIRPIKHDLPGREAEYERCKAFIDNFLSAKTAAECMYVCGVPGSGKTATLEKVLRDIRGTRTVCVNGLEVNTPQMIFQDIWRQLKLPGKIPGTNAAQDQLTKHFSKSNVTKTILVIDEIDYLVTRNEKAIYTILDWTANPMANLAIIAISNTMSLPVSGRLHSRMGSNVLVFKPYTVQQIIAIVESRLTSKMRFERPALELLARRVANSSGDIRAALQLCRRACELAEDGALVKLEHVSRACQESWGTTSQKEAVEASTGLCKTVLAQVIASLVHTGGSLSISDVYLSLEGNVLFEERQAINETCIHRAVESLVAAGLLEEVTGRRIQLAQNLDIEQVKESLNCGCFCREMLRAV